MGVFFGEQLNLEGIVKNEKNTCERFVRCDDGKYFTGEQSCGNGKCIFGH